MVSVLLANAAVYGEDFGDVTPPVVEELDEVVITGDLMEQLRKRGHLKESIIKTESLTEKDMADKQACNLADAINNEPGIDMATSCSMCGIRRVTINGLKGEYTTVLVDGVPLNSTVSSYYGFDALSLAGIARVEIARGSGASLIAPEAIGGVINVVSKRAEKNGLQMDVSGGADKRLAIVGTAVGDGGRSRATAAAQYDETEQFDGDDNGVNEAPARRTQSGFVTFSRDMGDDHQVEFRVTHMESDTFGGPMDKGLFETLAPSGGGVAFVDNDVRKTYTGDPAATLEVINTRRTEAIARWATDFGGPNLVTTLSGAEQIQDSFYEDNDYANDDDTLYGDVRVNVPLGTHHLLTGGIDGRKETLRSTSHSYFDVLGVSKDDFDSFNTGFYIQDVWTPIPRVELSAAVRADQVRVDFRGQTIEKNEIDETVIVPRLHLKWGHTEGWVSRMSFGQGYRAPLTFFESEHGILDDGFDVSISNIERSHSAGYSLSYDTPRWTSTVSAAWTEVKDMAYINSEDFVRPTLVNDDGTVNVKMVDVSAGYQLTPSLNIGGSFERYFHQERYKGLLPVAAVEQRARLLAGWEKDGWDLNGTLTWVGARDLAPYGYGNRYNVYDGVTVSAPKSTHAPSYATVDFLVSKAVTPRFTVKAGVMNLFDYNQAEKESPLFFDENGEYDVVHIWGPLRGREVTVGVQMKF